MALAVGAAVALLSARRPWERGWAAAVLAWQPLGAVAAGAAVWEWRRRRGLACTPSADDDRVLFGELLLLGMSAGLPLRSAIEVAAHAAPPRLGEEARAVLRAAGHVGSAPALASARGELAPLWRHLAGATATGAPLSGTVQSFVDDARRDLRAGRLARIRRLPVRMLVPLTLLILPGFVVLTLGPALQSGLARLEL